MEWLDLTLPSPAANLALDEALLDGCERGERGECLRCWEPPTAFVVIGYGQRVDQETFPSRCGEDGVPVLRRCTGGGAVLQAPGCLNYSLVLSIRQRPELEGITATNRHVMQAHRQLFARLLGERVTLEGHTDLAWQGQKFSGNSQRRRRHSVLFHGTFLLAGFPIDSVARYLPMPSRQPIYRRHRHHEAFLTRLPLEPEVIKSELRSLWITGSS